MRHLSLFLALILAVLLYSAMSRADESRDAFVMWSQAAMLRWAPPHERAGETVKEAEARYLQIGAAAVDVAFAEPLTGPRGRSRALALLLTVAYFESGFRRDVDLGGELRQVGPGPAGWIWFPHARGDGGQSVCLGQVRVGRGKTAEGWTAEELVADRRKCFTAALHLIKKSFGACRRHAVVDRLSAYTTGRCQDNEPTSRHRASFLAARTGGMPVEASVSGVSGGVSIFP